TMTAKAQRAEFENPIVFPQISYSSRCRACTGKQRAVNVRFGSLADKPPTKMRFCPLSSESGQVLGIGSMTKQQ
ncbi:MAG: hypothetical protein WCB61_00035, partial [Pseudolabrys sp.]